jgi:anti-sigma B factor antagonist
MRHNPDEDTGDLPGGLPTPVLTHDIQCRRRTLMAGFLRRVSMRLDERMVGDVAIVTVTGDITLNKGGDVALRDKVRSLLQQGYHKVLLDLGAVSYVDSAGLGELVQAYATTKNKGGSLKLLRATKRITDLLIITKLVTVFDSYDTEAAAIASFSAV